MEGQDQINQEPQVDQTQSPAENPPVEIESTKRRMLLLLAPLAVIFIILLVIVSAYFVPNPPGYRWPPLMPINTTAWQTYTTDGNLDIWPQPATIDQPAYSLSFKYPKSWKIIPADDVTKTANFGGRPIRNLGFTLANNEYQNDPNSQNAGVMRMMYAKVPEGTKAFDKKFWQMQVLDSYARIDEKVINGSKTSLAYEQKNGSDPSGVIFQLSPTEQVYVMITLNNYEIPFSCMSSACKETVNEIASILSTFKFVPSKQTDIMTTWKTYTNSKYGFSLMIPPQMQSSFDKDVNANNKVGIQSMDIASFYEGKPSEGGGYTGPAFAVSIFPEKGNESWITSDQSLSDKVSEFSIAGTTVKEISGLEGVRIGPLRHNGYILQFQTINPNEDPTYTDTTNNLMLNILKTFKFTDQQPNMAGKFIWNVPENAIAADLEKEIKNAFMLYNPPEDSLLKNTTNHLSVDGIRASTVSANFALANLSYRDQKNNILPTDGIAYYLQEINNKWIIISSSDSNFCKTMVSFPNDILDKTGRTFYYGCPK